MTDEKKEKWYFRNSSIAVLFFVVGPLSLPLVWANKRYSKATKIGITIAMIAFSYGLFALTHASVKSISNYYNQVLQ